MTGLQTKAWLFLNKFRFNHQRAQEYELESARKWYREKFENVYRDLQNPNDERVYLGEWFDNDNDLLAFHMWIDDKPCMEIGSGPSGNIIYWKYAGKRYIIDPLIDHYKQISLELYGKTWFTNMALIAHDAETFEEPLEGYITGAIVCRNTLDHCKNPLLVLENISRYARPGCYLLLWTDLYHIGGHDEGHRDITRNPGKFARAIEKMGFDIEYICPPHPGGRPTINYGCRARKREVANVPRSL